MSFHVPIAVCALQPMKKLVSPLATSTILLAEICSLLPFRALWWASCLWGSMLYYARTKRRIEVEKAFARLCQSAGISESPRVLTRKFFHRQFMEMAGHYVMRKASAETWARFSRFEGMYQVHDVLKEGQGLILCTVHFGTNLITTTRLDQLGINVVSMRPAFMDKIRGWRHRRMMFLHKDNLFVGESSGLSSPLRQAIRILRRNDVVGVAMDGDQGGGLTQAPLLGGNYPIRRGALEIARLSRSPMVFAMGAIRDRKFVVRWFPVQRFGEPGTEQATIDKFFCDSMKHFEDMIREFPECIWWTRPMSEALGLKDKAMSEEDSTPD